MKLSLVLFLCLIWGLCAYAQSPEPVVSLPQTGIKVAFLATPRYPGFDLGIERPYLVTQLEKTRHQESRYISKTRYLSANLGYYHHPTYHDLFFLRLEHQYRRQGSGGWFTEWAPGVGFSRSFLGGETYSVSDGGQITRKTLAGFNYALVSLSGGGGYRFAKERANPVLIYAKTSVLCLFPSNSNFYLRPVVSLGVVFSSGSFLAAHPTLKMKKK